MTSITVAYGDGIGPEIMTSVLEIVGSAGAKIQIETIEIGQKIYEKGWQTGITDSAWNIIKKNPVLLKAPITTPRGGGVKSLNVTLRKRLGLFANIRPCISYFADNKQSSTDLVIVRENEEDLYAGIEYKNTQDSYTCIKVITESASRRICKYAFEYAKANNRKKVTILVKDNIMKMTDGVFHSVFKEVAKEYPQIKSENYIIDIGAAKIATRPESFDVIVTSNLYGDIVSDIAAEVTGSVGLCGSVNLGQQYAMFEAVHGSAPDIAGKNIANPSGLLNAAIYMLGFIGQRDVAQRIYSAWIKTIKSGIHTADIYNVDVSKQKISTKEFTQAVIKNLKEKSEQFACCNFVRPQNTKKDKKEPLKQQKTLVGVDIVIDWQSEDLDMLLEQFKELQLTKDIMLGSISVKGVSIWPEKPIASDLSADCLYCRFLAKENSNIDNNDVNHLLKVLQDKDIDVVKIEKLYIFDKDIGFSL